MKGKRFLSLSLSLSLTFQNLDNKSSYIVKIYMCGEFRGIFKR